MAPEAPGKEKNMQSLHDAARPANTDVSIPPVLDRRNDTDEILLGQINRAVASLIVEEVALGKAQEGVRSKSKEVGRLLIEARKCHPKVADFKAFLSRVNGLKLSRAYDLIRIADGDKNIEEKLRGQTRKRVQRHRARKKQSKPAPVSVTHRDVTESNRKAGSSTPRPESEPRAGATGSAEIIEQRKADMARLDEPVEETVTDFDRRVGFVIGTALTQIQELPLSEWGQFFAALRDRLDETEREVLRDADDGVAS
jgi:hypothetical protein